MSDTRQVPDFETFKIHFLKLNQNQKVGFVLWPSLGGLELTEHEMELLKKYKPSGVVLFKRNLSNESQAYKLINEINTCLKHDDPFFNFKPVVSIDEEGGRVSRLPFSDARGKPALYFAQNDLKKELYEQINKQCIYAKRIGVNCFLAPVVDILTRDTNTAIGDRAFGQTAHKVIEFSSIVYDVLRENNIFPCVKHFPGHGDTVTDTHLESAKLDLTFETLFDREWKPYIHFIEKNIPFIMAAHVCVQDIDPNTPATLSKKILTDILRHQLKFKGLVLSDDLRMNAIKHYYNYTKTNIEASITETHNMHNTDNNNDDSFLKQASVDALLAGCDILLSCQSIEREKIILETLVLKMEQDKNFEEFFTQKAYQIYTQLLKTSSS